MIGQVVAADAIWSAIDAALIGLVLLGLWWWRRRQRRKAGDLPADTDPYCRHCARCEACLTPGKCHTDCTRGPFYCGRCRADLHAMHIPPERPE